MDTRDQIRTIFGQIIDEAKTRQDDILIARIERSQQAILRNLKPRSTEIAA